MIIQFGFLEGSMKTIDITFDVYSDTPVGKDPDAHSSTLRTYHKFLWDKSLPNGSRFFLMIKLLDFFTITLSQESFFYQVIQSATHTAQVPGLIKKCHILLAISLKKKRTTFLKYAALSVHILFFHRKELIINLQSMVKGVLNMRLKIDLI